MRTHDWGLESYGMSPVFYFKAPGRPLQQDFLSTAWGSFVSYVEVSDDQLATRQVDLFENHHTLRYDRGHWCDDFGRLTGLKFSRQPKWKVFFPGAETITAEEFEKVWHEALRSELWEQQTHRSRVPQWGAFRVSS